MGAITYYDQHGEVRSLHMAEIFDALVTRADTVPDEVRKLFADLRSMTEQERGQILNLREDGSLPVNFFNIARGPNQKGAISYVTPSKALAKVEDNWEKASRTAAKPGRVLRNLLKDAAIELYGINDRVVEVFTNVVKAYAENEFQVVLVPSNEIRDWYCLKRVKKGGNRYYADKESPAFWSCQHWTDRVEQARDPKTFKFYDALAPAGNLQMAVVLNKDGLLVGRTLVWRAEGFLRSYDGNKSEYRPQMMVSDYVYGDEVKPLLLKYGEERGWLYYSRGYGAKYPDGFDYIEWRVATGFNGPIGITRPYLDSTTYDDTHHQFVYNSGVRSMSSFDKSCDEARAKLDKELVQTPLPLPELAAVA